MLLPQSTYCSEGQILTSHEDQVDIITPVNILFRGANFDLSWRSSWYYYPSQHIVQRGKFWPLMKIKLMLLPPVNILFRGANFDLSWRSSWYYYPQSTYCSEGQILTSHEDQVDVITPSQHIVQRGKFWPLMKIKLILLPQSTYCSEGAANFNVMMIMMWWWFKGLRLTAGRRPSNDVWRMVWEDWAEILRAKPGRAMLRTEAGIMRSACLYGSSLGLCETQVVPMLGQVGPMLGQTTKASPCSCLWGWAWWCWADADSWKVEGCGWKLYWELELERMCLCVFVHQYQFVTVAGEACCAEPHHRGCRCGPFLHSVGRCSNSSQQTMWSCILDLGSWRQLAVCADEGHGGCCSERDDEAECNSGCLDDGPQVGLALGRWCRIECWALYCGVDVLFRKNLLWGVGCWQVWKPHPQACERVVHGFLPCAGGRAC